MNGLPWFRMYAEFATDPKIQAIAFEDQRHFVVLLCLKARGVLDSYTGSAQFRERMIGVGLGLTEDKREEAKKRLMEAGLIDSEWQPIAWAKRQFRSDSDPTGAERQQRWRERNALRNGQVTLTDTDTDTDTEGEEKKKTRASAREPPPEELDVDAWKRWEDYRREIRRPIKPASILAAQRKLAGFGAEQAAVVEQTIANGWQGLFALKADGPAESAPRRRRLTRFEELYGESESTG